MSDWNEALDEFLKFERADILEGPGKISHILAEQKALKEYEKYDLERQNQIEKEIDSKSLDILKGKSSMDKKEIGLRIKTIRKEKGLSQKELASLMGYKDVSTIAKIETGVNDVTTETLFKLANYLSVDIRDILKVNANYNKDYVKYIRSMVGHNKIIMNASGAIIEKDGLILLQRRSDNGKWGLPGGIMEMDETYQEGAIREVKEETGLDIKLDYLVGIYHNKNLKWPSGDKAHVICAVYKAHILSGDIQKDHESLELKFFSKDNLPEIAAIDHKNAINDFFNGVKNNID